MSILNKILFFFYMFFIIVLLSAFLAISVGIWPIEDFTMDLDNYRLPWLALLSVLLLVISFKYLFLSIMPSKSNSTLLKNTNIGSIKVSISTIDSIAQKALKSFADIKDVKTAVVPEASGVNIKAVLFIMPDVNIPDLTIAAQTKVKESIESTSGIAVREVQIYVDNAHPSQKSKVE